MEEIVPTDVDPLKVEICGINPWQVEDVFVFLEYCCPECEYRHKNLQSFQQHALENRKNASELFLTQNKGVLIEKVTIHEMETESFNPDALEIEPKDDLIDEPKNLQSSLIPSEDSIKKSTFINNVHKQLVQQCFLTKQTKLHCKCKVCGVQSTDLNWFAKHVAEHKQDTKRSENLPSVEESVLKLQKSGLKIQKFEEKSVLKVEPKIVQSTSIANEPIVNVPKSKPEPIIVNDLKEIIDTQKQEPIRTEKIPNIVLNELHDTSSLGNLSSLWQDIPSLIVNEPNPIVNELEEVSIIDSKNAETNQTERELKIILKDLHDTTSAKNLCSLWQDMPEPIVNELKEVLIVDFQKQEPITTPSSLDTGQKI